MSKEIKVRLVAYPKDAVAICAAAARRCYSARDYDSYTKDANWTPEEQEKQVTACIERGHDSVLEHAVFSFCVDMSRVTSHQLVRHRIVSYSQQSQRNQRRILTSDYITPPTIAASEAAAKKYQEGMNAISDMYQELLTLGIPQEDARYILPSGLATSVFFTMNIRELWHFLALRRCKRAQWEIRQIADTMQSLCELVAPVLFKNAGPDPKYCKEPCGCCVSEEKDTSTAFQELTSVI